MLLLFALFGSAAFAQRPAGPVQPSLSMQDSNLKPALPGALGVGIDQKLDQQVPWIRFPR